ncbi:hypothetical protein [Pandoraea pnomenusa]|uniref:hypothetical protein n=1 Tax=Pandoraea pnomenusa TaxID=93220 RepID=UPI003342BC3C
MVETYPTHSDEAPRCPFSAFNVAWLDAACREKTGTPFEPRDPAGAAPEMKPATKHRATQSYFRL